MTHSQLVLSPPLGMDPGNIIPLLFILYVS